jgi:hypothetical protein
LTVDPTTLLRGNDERHCDGRNACGSCRIRVRRGSRPGRVGSLQEPAARHAHKERDGIDRRIKDDDTGVVYLEFKPDGEYRGLSYYFARGNGCGYCGGGVTSTVKLANGRLSGSLKSSDDKPAFDLELDVPIVPDDHGAPLPADGGAPGKAYLAYHEALVKRDAKALRTALSDELRKTLDGATKEGKAAAYMSYLAKEHPSKSVQITKGFSKSGQAVLLIAGESSTVKLTGEVVLLSQGGSWRIDDELTDVVLQ